MKGYNDDNVPGMSQSTSLIGSFVQSEYKSLDSLASPRTVWSSMKLDVTKLSFGKEILMQHDDDSCPALRQRPLLAREPTKRSKKVHFSTVVEFVESQQLVTTAEEYESRWWSRNDFKIFRTRAGGAGHILQRSGGDLSTIDDALRRAETFSAALGCSDRMPSEHALVDIALSLCSSREWQILRGLEVLSSGAMESYCLRSKQNQISSVHCFQRRSPEILRCVLEHESHVSRILARIHGYADALAAAAK